jgi:putative ABC transport system permease protein
MNPFLRKLLYGLRWSRHDADLRAEIESHRALRQDALERHGCDPGDAAHESRRAMGNVTLAVDDARDVWAIRQIDSVRQDLRDAIRGLRRNAGVSAVVIGTLALGIGANTSLFSIFNSLVMRSSALLVQQLGGSVSLDLALDWRVLVFTMVLTGLCAIAAGLAPMAGVRSVAPGEALKSAGRGLAGDRRFAVRGALVVVQIAVSFVLVIGAGLFLRTFTALSQLPLGFAPESLVVVNLELTTSGIPPEKRGPLVDRLRNAAATTPGVRSASASLVRVLSGGGWFANNRVAVGDGPFLPENRDQRVWRNAVSPEWFDTMGIALLSGRDFTDSDRVGGPPVAIVNEAFARRYLPGQPPIGQTVRVGFGDTPSYEVIGLVADAVYTRPRDGMEPTFYVPIAQHDARAWTAWQSAVVTVNASPGQRAVVERDVVAALKRADPTMLFTSETFDHIVGDTVTQERLVAMTSGFLGALALLLAGLGLYGVVAQAVTARRTEIGVRMALGAQRAGIVRLVVRRVGALLAVGLVLGLMGSWWASRFVAPLLFEVEPRDLMTFAGTAAVLVAVGVVAAWLPARRAALVDPVTVLREG